MSLDATLLQPTTYIHICMCIYIQIYIYIYKIVHIHIGIITHRQSSCSTTCFNSPRLHVFCRTVKWQADDDEEFFDCAETDADLYRIQYRLRSVGPLRDRSQEEIMGGSEFEAGLSVGVHIHIYIYTYIYIYMYVYIYCTVVLFVVW